MNIWVTSDTHFGHKNICRGTSDWLKNLDTKSLNSQNRTGTRDFDTLEEMNQCLVDKINSHVKENDILWHLGDWSMGGIDNIKLFRQQLCCKNIHLILGNHDHHIAKKPELQSLFSSVQTTYGWPKAEKINGRRFIMCHFPLLVWEKHMHGAFHLHGHLHGSLNLRDFYKRKVMDVGIDCHPEFRPFHLDEIIQILDQREIVIIDHHTQDING